MTFEIENLRILTGNANQALAQDIANIIGVPVCEAFVGHFNNGEIQVMIDESIRGKDIYIIQPTSYPVNDNIMELLIMVDACKRASANSITAVVPYYAYARQDRKTRGREPISAKLVANLMTVAGVSRVVTVDLHAGQIQGFFDIPVDHLSATPVIASYLREREFSDLVVVSPDLGGVTRARKLADMLHCQIAIIEKRRPNPGEAEVMNLIGDVDGKTAVLFDDIVDTAGSLCEGAKALKARGAKCIYAACTHGILSEPAVERINESVMEKVIITDSIALPLEKQSPKIITLSLAKSLADAMVRIQNQSSVSLLFN